MVSRYSRTWSAAGLPATCTWAPTFCTCSYARAALNWSSGAEAGAGDGGFTVQMLATVNAARMNKPTNPATTRWRGFGSTGDILHRRA